MKRVFPFDYADHEIRFVLDNFGGETFENDWVSQSVENDCKDMTMSKIVEAEQNANVQLEDVKRTYHKYMHQKGFYTTLRTRKSEVIKYALASYFDYPKDKKLISSPKFDHDDAMCFFFGSWKVRILNEDECEVSICLNAYRRSFFVVKFDRRVEGLWKNLDVLNEAETKEDKEVEEEDEKNLKECVDLMRYVYEKFPTFLTDVMNIRRKLFGENLTIKI